MIDNSSDTDTKVFRRIKSPRTRSTPELFPVREIYISSKGISILKGTEIFAYDWDKVNKVEVQSIDTLYVGLGQGGGKMVKKLLVISADARKFKLDITYGMGNFSPSVLEELAKYTKISEIFYYTLARTKFFWVLIIIPLFISLIVDVFIEFIYWPLLVFLYIASFVCLGIKIRGKLP